MTIRLARLHRRTQSHIRQLQVSQVAFVSAEPPRQLGGILMAVGILVADLVEENF